jgi:16S rRNA (cytosine1402-N4)-methyltransferase
MAYHIPVLLHEAIEALDIQPDGTYVDVTFGGGGHSRAILEQLGENGRLFGFDQDEDAKANVPDDERFTFVQSNFRYLTRFLKLHGVRQADGILADLGVSSHQLDTATRGFSYRFEADLDMRMNQGDDKTAADILNTFPHADLQAMFSEYGEVRNSRTLAQAIVDTRAKKPFKHIADLMLILKPLARGEEMRYYSQVFQALRMEVNKEIEVLEEMLQNALESLKPGGRLVVITFHSIEDRVVKNFMKSGNIQGELVKDFYGNITRPFDLVNKKAIEPSDKETKENSRSRSSKLRIAIKKASY